MNRRKHLRKTALSLLACICHLISSICLAGETFPANDAAAGLPVEIETQWGFWEDDNPWSVRRSSVGSECFDDFSLPDSDWIAEKIAGHHLITNPTDRQVIDLALDEWIQPQYQSRSRCLVCRFLHGRADQEQLRNILGLIWALPNPICGMLTLNRVAER